MYLRSSLSGQGLVAVATLRAANQGDYEVMKRALLPTYHISSETYRKKVFDQSFNTNNPYAWFRMYKQPYGQWIESTEKTAFDAVLLELVLRKLPHWLEAQMRNLNPATYEELNKAVVRHMANQRREGKEKREERPGQASPS